MTMVTAATYEATIEEFRELEFLRPLTASDLAAFPDDGHRFKIIGGELYVSPSPTYRHQKILVQLVTLLNLHLLNTNTGQALVAPLDVRLSMYDVVQPDILVILNERVEIICEDRIEGAPDLVVEILSPSSIAGDYIRKAALYARHGVREYWIVNPLKATIDVQSLEDGRFVSARVFERDDLLISPLLAGFELPLPTVFPELPIAPEEPESTSDVVSEESEILENESTDDNE